MKLRLVLPTSCPYDCFYCYKEGVFSGRESHLEANDFAYLIKKAGNAGFDELKLTGGEPTEYPQLFKLISAARNAGYPDIRMTTIGNKLEKPSYCQDLKEAGLDGVTLSVNSFNQNTYEAMTRAKKGGFTRMLMSLENAVDTFGHSVTLNTVLNRLNLGELGDLMNYASERGLGVKILEMLDEDGKVPKGLYVPIEEFKKKYGFGKGKMINPTRELIRKGGARIYLVNSCCARKECGLCRKGYQVVRATADGKLKTCISNEADEVKALDAIKGRKDKELADILAKVTGKFS